MVGRVHSLHQWLTDVRAEKAFLTASEGVSLADVLSAMFKDSGASIVLTDAATPCRFDTECLHVLAIDAPFPASAVPRTAMTIHLYRRCLRFL